MWQQQLTGFEVARRTVTHWMPWYNEDRPHHALQYRSPHQYLREKGIQVA
ncbi:MAG: transposase [Nitrospirales bacterium]|nr:transposase [Nitrospirales bacterium]